VLESYRLEDGWSRMLPDGTPCGTSAASTRRPPRCASLVPRWCRWTLPIRPGHRVHLEKAGV